MAEMDAGAARRLYILILTTELRLKGSAFWESINPYFFTNCGVSELTPCAVATPLIGLDMLISLRHIWSLNAWISRLRHAVNPETE